MLFLLVHSVCFYFIFWYLPDPRKLSRKNKKKKKKREIVGFFLLYKNSRKSLRFLLSIRHFLDFSII